MFRVVFVSFVILFMSSAQAKESGSASVPSALALNLAEYVVAGETVDPRLKIEFEDRINRETRHFKRVIESKYQGDKLAKGLEAIKRFDDEMSAQVSKIVSSDSLIERLAVYYDKNFTRKEIKTLLKVFKKDVWGKYQTKMNSLELDPDKILGFRADFESRLKKTRTENIGEAFQ